MENLFVILILVSLTCFLLSWIIPNTFSPLFKDKLSEGKIRLVFGLSTIAFFVLFGITSDSSDNSEIKKEEPMVFKEEPVASKEKSEVVNSSENNQEDAKEEVSEVEEKDFAIYDEFFNVKNEQVKRIDQLINNLSITKHQEIIKMLKPGYSEEWNTLSDVQKKLFAVEEKLNENNSSHKLINEALDFYYYFADDCKDWLILLPSDLDFSDWNNFKLADNSLVEQIPKECGAKYRKSGDEKAEELLTSLRQRGYKSSFSENSILAKTPAQIPQVDGYKQIFSFSGEGTKNSETFTITGSKFRIKYDCSETTRAPLCQAVLRSPNDESLYKEIFNIIGETESETIFYKKGTFYIEASVMGGEFDIIVEEYR